MRERTAEQHTGWYEAARKVRRQLPRMPMDSDAVAAYMALDNSAPVGMLPLLEGEIERHLTRLKRLDASRERHAERDAGIAEQFAEALAGFDGLLGPTPEGREQFRHLQEEVHAVLRGLPDGSHTTKFMGAISRHLDDLMRRKHWIMDELRRRRLLPEFPA